MPDFGSPFAGPAHGCKLTRPQARANLANRCACPVGWFSATIDPPAAIALAAGAIPEVPRVEDDRVVPWVTATRFEGSLRGHLESVA